MEDSFPIESFKYGVDTRRSVLTSQVGTLVTCENGFINQGGEIEKRKKFDDPGYGADTFDDDHRTVTITSVSDIATVTLSGHGLTSGEFVQISGANEADYNGIFEVTVLTSSTFTYDMNADPSSPATGTIVLDYVGTYGLEATDAGLIVFGSARDADEDYVTTTGVASVATKGIGTGATFNITAVSGAITAAVVNAGGTGYVVGDILTLTTATGTGAILTVATLSGSAVATVTITNNGNEQLEPFLATGLTTVVYQQLKHPTLVNDSTEDYVALYHRMTAIVFSENYNGKAFACAQFTDGRRYLYYDGELIQHSVNGLALENRLALADLSNDTLRQFQAIGWTGLANRREVTLDSISRVGTTATATYATHGLTTGDTVEIRGVDQTEYNGRFIVTVTGANTFTYVMRADPGASATGARRGTIYQAGSTLIDSPGQDYFSGVPSETASAGQLGLKEENRNGTNVSGESALACFQVTGATGTFAVTAPEDSDGTGTADLVGGTVNAGTTTTATAVSIAAAINDLTFVHGYSATTSADNVYVIAPIDWGPVTFNLTVTPTTGSVGACGASAPLQASISPNGHNFLIRSSLSYAITSTPFPYTISVSGGTPFTTGDPYRYLWEPTTTNTGLLVQAAGATASSTQFVIGTPTGPALPVGNHSAVMYVTVTDSVGGATGTIELVALMSFQVFR